MNFQTATFHFQSEKPVVLIDLTDEVKNWVANNPFKNGLILVSSPHTTVAVKINEKCEKLTQDIENFFKKLAPPNDFYEHNQNSIDGRPNAHSHLLSMLISRQETIVVKDGSLALGTWQNIFAIELDGPRHRRSIELTFFGE